MVEFGQFRFQVSDQPRGVIHCRSVIEIGRKWSGGHNERRQGLVVGMYSVRVCAWLAQGMPATAGVAIAVAVAVAGVAAARTEALSEWSTEGRGGFSVCAVLRGEVGPRGCG